MNKRKSMIRVVVITMIFWLIFFTAGILYNNGKGNDTATVAEPNANTKEVSTEQKSEPSKAVQEVSSDSDKEESSKEESEDKYENTTYEYTEKQNQALEYFNGILEEELTQTDVLLDVEEMFQNPELPTGCESIALTVALNHFGFGLDKTDIADRYLIYGGDYVRSYLGSPYSEDGSGIFPPGLVKTAERFLADKESDLTAIETTGTDFKDFYKVLQKGYPVMIWSTMYLDKPSFSGDEEYYGESVYPWYWNEHCVVLYGYNEDYNTVYISDPLVGYVVYDADDFEEVFDKVGKISMVIINTEDEE